MIHPLSDHIVAEARSWIGTPYLHQACITGVGTDCLGLLRGVWQAVIGAEPETPPAYTMDWGDSADAPVLLQAARRYLVAKPRRAAAPGDVVLFTMRDGYAPKHVGLQGAVGDAPTIIHAYSGHAVVESPLSLPWARRIAARFEFPHKGS
ncbi:MAG: NlpC/P60 family protein [Pseudomonadota bacterium]